MIPLVVPFHPLKRGLHDLLTGSIVFRGSRLAPSGELEPFEAWQLFEQAARVAAVLHDARYFGPFGIDVTVWPNGA